MSDLTYSYLLTVNQTKVEKGEVMGWHTAILHLAPHNVSGYNVCPFATAECSAVCLEISGHGGIFGKADTVYLQVRDGRKVKTNSVRRARIARTWAYMERPEVFFRDLVREIRAHIRRAARLGMRPAIRLNGTSDIKWEDVPVTSDGVTYPHIFAMFPEVQFYDYTKIPGRTKLPPNYRLTFSFSGHNLADALAYLSAGGNVAVMFDARTATRGRAADRLPDAWHAFRVIDADVTDLRFLDPRGTVAGLRPKGKAKRLPVGGFKQPGRSEVTA